MPVEIREAATVDELVAASPLFDNEVTPEWAELFLARPGHHLFLAYDGAYPIGMISGVEMTHPDKGTEMFLYELAVAESHQRQGIGRVLVSRLAELAVELGCYGMWVGVDLDNDAALATYGSAGATSEGEFRMLGWKFDRTGVSNLR